ncbi:MAG: hypothetical protein WC915_04100 [archaeon]|jgi:hypothetical protein
MKIGLDFDGVISDCGELKSRGAKMLFGVDIPSCKFKKEIIVGEGLLTIDQYRELQKTIYGTREIGLLMKPIPGALEYISRLIEDGREVSVKTSRGGVELEIAKEWSALRGLSLDFVGVSGESKAEVAVGLDVYFDDDLEKLKQLVGIVPNRFLFSHGYNAQDDVLDIAKRIGSWNEFYCTIHAIDVFGGVR